jgi:hypothetical protein
LPGETGGRQHKTQIREMEVITLFMQGIETFQLRSYAGMTVKYWRLCFIAGLSGKK